MKHSQKGEIWRHERGLTIRVIADHVPGDRLDEPRVHCEVITKYTERISSDEIKDGFASYPVGHKDGWVLIEGMSGWKQITTGERFKELLARSSFGTKEAKRVSATVPRGLVKRTLRRADELSEDRKKKLQ